MKLAKQHTLRSDFTSNLVHGLAFGTQKFYIVSYGKINHGLVNLGPVVKTNDVVS